MPALTELADPGIISLNNGGAVMASHYDSSLFSGGPITLGSGNILTLTGGFAGSLGRAILNGQNYSFDLNGNAKLEIIDTVDSVLELARALHEKGLSAADLFGSENVGIFVEDSPDNLMRLANSPDYDLFEKLLKVSPAAGYDIPPPDIQIPLDVYDPGDDFSAFGTVFVTATIKEFEETSVNLASAPAAFTFVALDTEAGYLQADMDGINLTAGNFAHIESYYWLSGSVAQLTAAALAPPSDTFNSTIFDGTIVNYQIHDTVTAINAELGTPTLTGIASLILQDSLSNLSAVPSGPLASDSRVHGVIMEDTYSSITGDALTDGYLPKTIGFVLRDTALEVGGFLNRTYYGLDRYQTPDPLDNRDLLIMSVINEDGDLILGDGGLEDTTGSEDDDYLNGDTLPGLDDVIFAFSGFDNIYGDDGKDYLHGGHDDDYIYGDDSGSGDDDWIVGGDGDDWIDGKFGDDVIYGGQGTDTIYGNDGQDTIYGGPGADVIDGGDDNDWIEDDEGFNVINGGFGNDTIIASGEIHGGGDSDYIWGKYDDDVIYGDDGVDTIYAEDGNDLISGGEGDDTLYGGDGSDIFTYTALNHLGDTIADFGSGTGTDVIMLDKGVFTSFPTTGTPALTQVAHKYWNTSSVTTNTTYTTFLPVVGGNFTATRDLVTDSSGWTLLTSDVNLSIGTVTRLSAGGNLYLLPVGSATYSSSYYVHDAFSDALTQLFLPTGIETITEVIHTYGGATTPIMATTDGRFMVFGLVSATYSSWLVAALVDNGSSGTFTGTSGDGWVPGSLNRVTYNEIESITTIAYVPLGTTIAPGQLLFEIFLI
jgi:Ca2+-binding RTX toxin-like protein